MNAKLPHAIHVQTNDPRNLSRLGLVLSCTIINLKFTVAHFEVCFYESIIRNNLNEFLLILCENLNIHQLNLTPMIISSRC